MRIEVLIMWENEEKFPSAFECPPKNAFSYMDKLYKVSATNKENDRYLRKTMSDDKKISSPEKMCQACGHSVFLNEKDLIETKREISKVNKGIAKKWNYINSFKASPGSKILPTPSKTSYNHHTYWHYGDYNMIFCNECQL